jgi:hypothetical protein
MCDKEISKTRRPDFHFGSNAINIPVYKYRKKMEDSGLNVGVHFLRLFSSCAHFLPHKSLSSLTAFFDEQFEVCRKS